MNEVKLMIEGKESNLQMVSNWGEMHTDIWLGVSSYLESGEVFNKDVVKSLVTNGSSKVIDKIPDEGFLPLYDSMDWLLKDPCTEPPFEFFKIGREKFHLPGARLGNIAIIEFAFLDMAWELSRFFTERGDIEKADEWITKLAMYMARPIDKRINPNDPNTYMGDRREKFNTAVIEERWPLFQKIDPAYRFGCLWFFLGCKAYIHQKYKGKLWFDTHDEEGNEIIGVQKDDKPQPLRWIEICRKLAGGKFGTLKETQFANLYEVLDEMVDQRKSQ